jgi:hypothetical protein
MTATRTTDPSTEPTTTEPTDWLTGSPPRLNPAWSATSERTDLIFGAFVEALGEMSDIVRTKTAKVEAKSGASYEYKYAELVDAFEMARPILAAHSLALTQSVTNIDEGPVRVWTTLLHVSGQWLTFLPMEWNVGRDPQVAGSAMTYGRRYCAMAALGLATDDDDGQAASQASREPRRQGRTGEQEPPQATPAPTYTDEQKVIVEVINSMDQIIAVDAGEGDEAGTATGAALRKAFFKVFGHPSTLDHDGCERAAKWLMVVAAAAKNGTEAAMAAVEAQAAIAAAQVAPATTPTEAQDPPGIPQESAPTDPAATAADDPTDATAEPTAPAG